MTQAVVMRQTGDAGVLKLEKVETPLVRAGEVMIEQDAIGVNFLDILHRRGDSPLPQLPAVLGGEGAGRVVAIGDGVSGLKVGDRVAYMGGLGGYASRRSIAAERVVRLPDGIEPSVAAASLLKGLTAHYLLRRLCALQPGDAVLFHAAAGGVGLLFAQWARHLGVTVIGTVSTPEKAELARAYGCTHVVVGYDREKILNTVIGVTDGQGVALACDSVGLATFETSIAATRKRGTIASFGSASGRAPAIQLGHYFGRALFFTMPNVAAFNEGADFQRNADDLFGLIGQGVLTPLISHRFALAEAAQAHAAMENRQTTGSIILVTP